MKASVNSFAVYILLVIAQVIITNYFHLSQFIVLSILPVMVLCLPLSLSNIATMLIAFATGMSVDLLAEGVLGMNTLCLLPVALLRKRFIAWTLGEDVVTRASDFSFRRNGSGKTTVAVLMAVSTFLLVFIITDGAGTRSFWFNFARMLASVICSLLLSIPVASVLNREERR